MKRSVVQSNFSNPKRQRIEEPTEHKDMNELFQHVREMIILTVVRPPLDRFRIHYSRDFRKHKITLWQHLDFWYSQINDSRPWLVIMAKEHLGIYIDGSFPPWVNYGELWSLLRTLRCVCKEWRK